MKQKTIFGFPQNVFILSFVSFLNDIGGQTIKYAIPLFLSNALGVKTSIIGLVEGIGEATPTLFQPLSGIISDKVGRKKLLVSGWILYALVYLGFAKSTSSLSIILLFLTYGVYYGLTEGVAKAYVADIVPQNKRALLLAGIIW